MFCTYGVFVMLWGSTVAWSKGYSLHVVGLLLLNSAQIVPTPPAPRNGGPFQLFLDRPVKWTRWLAGAIKSG